MADILYKIINGRVVTPSGIIKDGQVVIRNGRIAEVGRANVDIPQAQVVDAGGGYVAPGCIDLHVHGGGGHDFSEATPEAFRRIAQAHALCGVTALCPTVAAADGQVFRQAIRCCEHAMSHPSGQGAAILGLHLEGNYINPAMKGGLDGVFLHAPDPEEYEALLSDTTCIKRWSASPELPGACEFARYASARGVLVSLAHTTAGYAQLKEACRAGFRHVTHFYNAMTSVHKEREFKHEGTVEAVYLMRGLSVEVIADGIHVPPPILRLVYQIKGPEQTALVTDAIAAAACEGDYARVLDEGLVVEDGVCKLADRSALAGSIATGIRLIRVMVEQAEIPLADVMRMAAETPARLMGIAEKKGTLAAGKDADVILFTPRFEMQATFVEGRMCRKSLSPDVCGTGCDAETDELKQK